MKKKCLAMLLAVALAVSLLPGTAFAAAKSDLPDWYFLFAVFKNVDADVSNMDGEVTHVKYSMSQEEVDLAREQAKTFEAFMNEVGVMNAHVEVAEINGTVTELQEHSTDHDSYLAVAQAAPLLEAAGVDLDRYDHVTCIINYTVRTGAGGRGGSSYENGAGHSCVNFLFSSNTGYIQSVYVHELLHFMENMSKKWGITFGLHITREKLYASAEDNYMGCYTDIILNRVKGDAETGTGVLPGAWRYPPRVLRTTSELTVPDGAAAIGEYAFYGYTNLKSVTIPNSVTSIERSAFSGCSNLESVTIPSSVASIGEYAFYGCGNLRGSVTIPNGATSIGEAMFYNCASLERVTIPNGVTSIGGHALRGCSSLTEIYIPASVTGIGYAAFWDTGLTDVYYGGTQEQWNAIQMDEYNTDLTKVNVHYNSAAIPAFPDTPDWCSAAANWGADQGVVQGIGGGLFGTLNDCTNVEILTFLWRAAGSPSAARAPVTAVPYLQDFQDAINWAYANSMIDGAFVPNALCTRASAVKYIWQARGSESAKASSFTDVSSGADYYDAVNWADANGIAAGTGGSAFSPDNTCTRGEIVTFLHRAYVPEARLAA